MLKVPTMTMLTALEKMLLDVYKYDAQWYEMLIEYLGVKSPKYDLTFEDRWDRQKSIEIFKIYCNHYNLITPEEKARCWNGGPRGLQKLTTKRYWEKVKKHLAIQN